MTEESPDTLKLTEVAKTKVGQLNAAVQMAEALRQQYVQGCLDTLMLDGDKSNWVFDVNEMAFHRVKEAPKGEETK